LMDWRTESCRQTQHGKMRKNAHLPTLLKTRAELEIFKPIPTT
jgi:hypothetical protein